MRQSLFFFFPWTLLLGMCIAPTEGFVSTGNVFSDSVSCSCCLQWKWHCMSPTALTALAWFKLLRQWALEVQIVSAWSKISFFPHPLYCIEWWGHDGNCLALLPGKKHLVDTKSKDTDSHYALKSDWDAHEKKGKNSFCLLAPEQRFKKLKVTGVQTRSFISKIPEISHWVEGSSDVFFFVVVF